MSDLKFQIDYQFLIVCKDNMISTSFVKNYYIVWRWAIQDLNKNLFNKVKLGIVSYM